MADRKKLERLLHTCMSIFIDTMKRTREETVIVVRRTPEAVFITFERGTWTHEFACTPESHTASLEQFLRGVFEKMYDERRW